MIYRTKYEQFLRSFFEIELTWMADKAYQMQNWSHSDGENFITDTTLFIETWAMILDNPKDYNLSTYQIKMIHQVEEMIRAFHRSDDFPIRPSDFRSVVENSHLKKIRLYAREVYDKIYPTLK